MKAEIMLRQNLDSVKDIAYTTGFNSAPYFCACFKKEYGRSPLAFKRSSSMVMAKWWRFNDIKHRKPKIYPDMYSITLKKRNKMEILNYRERQGKTFEEIESSSKMMGYSFLLIILIAGCSIFIKQFDKKSAALAKAKQETLNRSQASR